MEPRRRPSRGRPGADSGCGPFDWGSPRLEGRHDPSCGTAARLHCAPLLYEHFRDKQEILTELAMEGQLSLAREPARELPDDPNASALLMVEHYCSFMLENKQLYRLMNGMDGVPIDRERVSRIAQRSFEDVRSVIQAWFIAHRVETADTDLLLENCGLARWHGLAAPGPLRPI
jgi:AcrR family transcriptional regulator